MFVYLQIAMRACAISPTEPGKRKLHVIHCRLWFTPPIPVLQLQQLNELNLSTIGFSTPKNECAYWSASLFCLSSRFSPAVLTKQGEVYNLHCLLLPLLIKMGFLCQMVDWRWQGCWKWLPWSLPAVIWQRTQTWLWREHCSLAHQSFHCLKLFVHTSTTKSC